MAAEEKPLRIPHFRLPRCNYHKIRDALSQTNLHPCAKFQPNPFSSFGGGASRTDRQTVNLNSCLYHREIITEQVISLDKKLAVLLFW